MDITGALCEICGEPMPPGEQMFKYHGYSGSCPKPPLLKESIKPDLPTELAVAIARIAILQAEVESLRADSARLDWIEVNCPYLPTKFENIATDRKSIDAAKESP